MICPATHLAMASGLMMLSVRSTGIGWSSSFRDLFLADDACDGRAHVGGASDRDDTRSLHGLHLLRRRALPARDDRAGVAHAAARRGRLAADEADDGLSDLGLDERRGLFLGRAADLADHHDLFRL